MREQHVHPRYVLLDQPLFIRLKVVCSDRLRSPSIWLVVIKLFHIHYRTHVLNASDLRMTSTGKTESGYESLLKF